MGKFLPQFLVVPASGDYRSTANWSRDGQESDEHSEPEKWTTYLIEGPVRLAEKRGLEHAAEVK